MICPLCGTKTRVIDVRFNADENEVYRQRICKNPFCEYKFFSVEFETENDKNFNKQWKEAIRGGRHE